MSFLAKVRYSISAKILSDEYYDSSKLRDILSKQLPRVRLIKHGIIAAAKYDHIDFKPSAGAKASAKRGLELRKEFGRGGTSIGVAIKR